MDAPRASTRAWIATVLHARLAGAFQPADARGADHDVPAGFAYNSDAWCPACDEGATSPAAVPTGPTAADPRAG